MVFTFYHTTPGATKFSDWSTTDRGWVSGNTRGYKVQTNMFSTVASARATKKSTPLNHQSTFTTIVNTEWYYVVICEKLIVHVYVFLYLFIKICSIFQHLYFHLVRTGSATYQCAGVRRLPGWREPPPCRCQPDSGRARTALYGPVHSHCCWPLLMLLRLD